MLPEVLIGVWMEQLMLGSQSQLGVKEEIVAHGGVATGSGRSEQTRWRVVQQLAELVQRRTARIQTRWVQVG